MKKFIFAAIAMLAIGCTKQEVKDAGSAAACAMQASVVNATAAAVAVEMQCAHAEAIAKFLDGKAAPLNICKPVAAPAAGISAQAVDTKSVVGAVICAPLVETMSSAALATIPAEWGCTGGQKVDDIKAKLMAACQKSI